MEWLFLTIWAIIKIAIYLAVIFAVVKVFVIARDVEEIKKILLTGRR